MNNFVILTGVAASLAAASVGFFEVADSPDISAEIAVEAALDQFREPASSRCQNCNGTGKIGDTKVVFDCPVCKGTGKTQCFGSCVQK